VQPHFGAKLRKSLAVGGSARNFDDVYDGFIDEWALERSPVIGATVGAGANVATAPLVGVSDTVHTMYRDVMTYLPDDIEQGRPRSDGVSLETRVRFSITALPRWPRAFRWR